MKRSGPPVRVTPLKRTPFKRAGGELAASTLPASSPARTTLPKQSKKRRILSGLKPIPTRTRELVKERDQYRCVAGGCWLGETGGHIHHRKLRSQGGTHEPANLIYLCFEHHHAIHRAPELAYELGYLVRSLDDPALIRIEANWPDAA